MTATSTTTAPQPSGSEAFDDLLGRVADEANALDRNERQARSILTSLAEVGRLDSGLPINDRGGLPEMAETLALVAERCMSSAFTTWAHRMTLEYLAVADTDYARELLVRMREGGVPGVTGMASAFKEYAGCGELDLRATPSSGGGYVVDGTLRWASNLYEDAVMVTAAKTPDGERLLIALPLDTAGVSIGAPFSLMALESTQSSFLTLEGVEIRAEQVLSTDFMPFLATVRPTFAILQSALAVGLARTCIAEARKGLKGINEVFAGEVDQLAGSLTLTDSAVRNNARNVGTELAATPVELLSMRLKAAEVAFDGAVLETKTAGGKGYAKSSGTSRRMREAVFFPVQSPSEGQLRWELAASLG